VRALSFRKRPSETHGGPGLETPTDAVTVVHGRPSSASSSFSSRPVRKSARPIFCYKYFSCCLAQRILCEVSFVSFSNLLPPHQLLSLHRNKASPDNANSKGPPDSHTTTEPHKACLVLFPQQRTSDHSPRQAGQSTLQRQRALGMSPTLGPADGYALKRAGQTAGCVSSNGFTYLQDKQEGIHEHLQPR